MNIHNILYYPYFNSGNSSYAKNEVSFCAMKKSQFSGIDLAIIEKFKAPIETFNSAKSLQDWALEQYNTIISNGFGGIKEIVAQQRSKLMQVWDEYLSDNKHLKPTEKYLILDGITKILKPNNDNIPYVLNKSILNSTIEELRQKLALKPLTPFDFTKMYKSKLNSYFTGSKNKMYTGWVVIPSKEKAPNDYEQNLIKLQTLSNKTWCTKSYMGDNYLEGGDIHIYVENNDPKLCLRFFKNTIVEIQGEKNDGKIPSEYSDLMTEYINKNKFMLVHNNFML